MRAKIKEQASTSVIHRIITAALTAVNLVVGCGLAASAYAGAINPIAHPTAPVVAMTFPIWLAAAVIMLVITIAVRIKISPIIVLPMIASLPSILDYCPLHLPQKVADDAETFTLMSYNVLGLQDQNKQYYGDVNPTISYILKEDPDIVCLQEMRTLHTSQSIHLTASQIDSLHCQYPYVFYSNESQAIFSKFPVEPVQTGYVHSKEPGAANIGCFRAEIKGRKVTIFDIHLQSFSLVSEDREMFAKLTHLKGSEHEISQMKSHLINKIRIAGPIRTTDTEELIKYIKKYGGPNVIVCGDFNDVPGSYPLRLLAGEHFKEVYPEVGFGPMITYNSGGFYFRIDHILYRGDMRPISMKRGDIKSSDHYPVTATFEMTNQ